MAGDSRNRERLRSGLLGPLGQEVTDMLMEELDQAGLRKHMDERFDEQGREAQQRLLDMEARFEKRFERIEDQLARLTDAVTQSSRPGNAVVYTVCGSTAVVALAALLQSLLNA